MYKLGNSLLFVLMVFAFAFLTACGSPAKGEPADEPVDDEFAAVERGAKGGVDELDYALGNKPRPKDEKDPFKKTEPKKTEPKKTEPKKIESDPEVKEIDSTNFRENAISKYPSRSYIIGIGMAQYKTQSKQVALRNAKGDAKDEVAAYFKTKIKSDLSLAQKTIKEIQGKVKHAKTFIRNEYKLKQSVEQIIYATEIKNVAYQKNPPVVYVLAVLERERVANSIKKELESLESKINGNYSLALTANSSKRMLHAAKLLSSTINLITKFHLKVKEFIIVAPAGWEAPKLTIEEGQLTQLLGELTINLTVVVKTRLVYADENDVEKIVKTDHVASQISKKLRAEGMIKLEDATYELKKADFDDVLNWDKAKLREVAPTASFIILADLRTYFHDTIELGGNTGYIAKTEFNVKMISTFEGEETIYITPTGITLNQTKATQNSLRSAWNSSAAKAGELVAKELFSKLGPE